MAATNIFSLVILKGGSIAVCDCTVALTCSQIFPPSSIGLLTAYEDIFSCLLGDMDGLAGDCQNKITFVEGSPDLPLVWGKNACVVCLLSFGNPSYLQAYIALFNNLPGLTPFH